MAKQHERIIVEPNGCGWLVHTFNANRWFKTKTEAVLWAVEFHRQYHTHRLIVRS